MRNTNCEMLILRRRRSGLIVKDQPSPASGKTEEGVRHNESRGLLPHSETQKPIVFRSTSRIWCNKVINSEQLYTIFDFLSILRLRSGFPKTKEHSVLFRNACFVLCHSASPFEALRLSGPSGSSWPRGGGRIFARLALFILAGKTI